MPETIGLDIGSHSIKLVGLKITSRGRVLTHFGVKEIPQASDKEDWDFIAEIIKALFREVGLKP
jgi:Tfp pilus assembly PilM family ATPase